MVSPIIETSSHAAMLRLTSERHVARRGSNAHEGASEGFDIANREIMMLLKLDSFVIAHHGQSFYMRLSKPVKIQYMAFTYWTTRGLEHGRVALV
jgi:hypothetical protein